MSWSYRLESSTAVDRSSSGTEASAFYPIKTHMMKAYFQLFRLPLLKEDCVDWNTILLHLFYRTIICGNHFYYGILYSSFSFLSLLHLPMSESTVLPHVTYMVIMDGGGMNDHTKEERGAELFEVIQYSTTATINVAKKVLISIVYDLIKSRRGENLLISCSASCKHDEIKKKWKKKTNF